MRLFFQAVKDAACDVYTAGTCLGEAAGHAGAIADGEDVLEFRLKFLGQDDAGAVEFDFDAVEQRVVVRHAWGDVVECLDHLDDVVEVALRQDEGQIARRCLERRLREALGHAVRIRAAAFHEVTEALDDDAAAEHVRE